MARGNFFLLLVVLLATILGSLAQCQPANCDDNNPCTTDSCVNSVCVHKAVSNGTSCDDNLWCNGKDVCSEGVCQHLGDPCARGAVCSNTCDEATLSCISALGTSCDDGMYCNGVDTCDGTGNCVSAGNPCANGDDCNDECNEDSKTCRVEDGTPCTNGMQCEQISAQCQSGKCTVYSSNNCTVVLAEDKIVAGDGAAGGANSSRIAIIAGSVGGGVMALVLVSVILALLITKRRRANHETKIDMEANTGDLGDGNNSAVSRLPPTGGLPGNLRMMLTPAETVNSSPLAVRRAVAYTSTTADRVRMETSARSIEEVQIGKPLGTGNFGEVFYGVWNKPEDNGDTSLIPVALKKLRRPDRFESFRGEVETLRHLGHTNIVQYFGVFADHNQHEMYLATEYMKMGSLMDLLQILGDKINEQQMLEMCFDAALGMAYLERSRIVHRDLNCRNLLVSTDDHGKYTVKVGDFSHAKCVNSGDNYISNDAMIPVRWSAVEVLRDSIFSSKSDVWSFGICMWEIFEKGREPYADCSDFQVSEWVLRGDRLERPQDCADDLYNVMTSCWRESPSDRPNFSAVIDLICHVIEDRKNATADDVSSGEESEEETAAGRVHVARDEVEESDEERL